MAFQLFITEGLHARGHASGDDSGIIIMGEDKDLVAERIGKCAASKAEFCEYGLGLLIDQEITWDNEIMVFLSKIVDFESSCVTRKMENVASTGCITSSKIRMAEINHAVYGQLKEYLSMIGFNGMLRARKNLDMENPGKAYLKDFRRLKDDSYKKDFARPNKVPNTYLNRVYDQIGGAKLTHHKIMDVEIKRKLAGINMSNNAIGGSNNLNQSK